MTLENWQIDLQEKGYAIIPGILDPSECAILENGYWNFWNRLTGGRLRKENPETWRIIYDFFPMHGMLTQHYSIGHMQEIWNVRSHKRVKKVFETIWGTDDLVVSFDGAATSLAPEVTNRGWHRKDWLHLDQSPHRSDFECAQAWVTAEDVGPGDGTLTLLEGSHKLHAEFAKHFGLKKDKTYRLDWLKLSPEHDKWYREHGCTQIAVECPKGSMVLWDSRTVHAGRSPVKGRETPHNRFVAYVCMIPASCLNPPERTKKQRACLEGRLTNHWAAGRVKLFPKYPRTYGQKLPTSPDFEPPFFTKEQARLAGWQDPELCPLTIENREDRQRAIESALREMDSGKRKKKQPDTDGLISSFVIQRDRSCRLRAAAAKYTQSLDEELEESAEAEEDKEWEDEKTNNIPSKKQKTLKNQPHNDEEKDNSDDEDFDGDSVDESDNDENDGE